MQNKTLIFILTIFCLIGAAIICVGGYFIFLDSNRNEPGAYFLPGMGLIFFLVGFVPFMIMQSKKRRNMQLLKTGRAIQAKVTSVEYNEAISVNGRSPFVIYCQSSDPLMPNKLSLFRDGIYR